MTYGRGFFIGGMPIPTLQVFEMQKRYSAAELKAPGKLRAKIVKFPKSGHPKTGKKEL